MKKTMKMNSSCVAGRCLDDIAQAPPVKGSSFVKHSESDAEFLIRRVNMDQEENTAIRFPFNSRRSAHVYHYHENFASRQRFLRSYTFSRKETVGEKTKRWLKRKKKKVGIKAESVQRYCRRGYSCRFVQVVHKLLGFLCRRR